MLVLGLNFKMIQLDCAYVPYGDLGDTYRVSLLSRFGRQRTEPRAQNTEKRGQKKPYNH